MNNAHTNLGLRLPRKNQFFDTDEKGRVLWFQSLFREFTLCYKIRNRFLSRVYHFSLLICYPYSLTGIAFS